MFVIATPFRKPRSSEMAISGQTKECIDTACSNLREALAFAARTEHPFIISNLTEILVRLESLDHMEEIMERFSKHHDLPTNLM